MEGIDIFNSYEIRARIFPSIIILLPIVVLFFSIIPLSDTIWKIMIELGIFIVIVYGVSYPVRMLGINFQKNIWTKDGAAPSTKIMRWDDPTLGQNLKLSLYGAVSKKYMITIPDENEQSSNPNSFDQIIEDIFIRVRADLRKGDKDNLWSSQNAEYGFVRNLIGSRSVWLALSFICAAIGLILYSFEVSNIKLLAVGVNSIFCLISLIGGWYVLPKMFDYIGYEYAKNVWMAFLSFSKNE